jgi:hypothetical protein
MRKGASVFLLATTRIWGGGERGGRVGGGREAGRAGGRTGRRQGRARSRVTRSFGNFKNFKFKKQFKKFNLCLGKPFCGVVPVLAMLDQALKPAKIFLRKLRKNFPHLFP